MKYRKPRIAWSVLWGVVAVLLIALWVRSYWYHDYVNYLHGGGWSCQGTLCIVSISGGASVPWSPVTNKLTDSNESKLVRFANPLIWTRRPGYFAAWVAYWVVCLLALVVAIVPWIRWRFSLRTLFVVTTLVGVILSLVAGIPRNV